MIMMRMRMIKMMRKRMIKMMRKRMIRKVDGRIQRTDRHASFNESVCVRLPSIQSVFPCKLCFSTFHTVCTSHSSHPFGIVLTLYSQTSCSFHTDAVEVFAPEVNNSVNVCVQSYIVESIFAIVQHGFFATSDQLHKSVSTLMHKRKMV